MFGVLKNTWKILKDKMPRVSKQRQIDIILSCCVLHNFSQIHEEGIPIWSKQANILTTPNVGLYNEQNKQIKNEYRDVISNMISS